MEEPRVIRQAVVRHEHGLHLRPADQLAKCARRFAARVELCKEGVRVDAKSILGIVGLAAVCGSEITIEARGVDAETAAATLAELIGSEFEIADESPA